MQIKTTVRYYSTPKLRGILKQIICESSMEGKNMEIDCL